MRLVNKVIIITGSCTGIGKAIALQCVREGAKVVINGLDEQLGIELIAVLGSENATIHCEDITLEGAAQRLIETAIRTFGRLDSVVNNAAMITASNIQTTTLPFFRQIIETNALAPFAIIQAALPYLTTTKGSVLNIGSVNAWCGEPDLLAYSVSKGALQTLTRNLGDTLNRENGVRVNQVNPGWVLTEKEAQLKKELGFDDEWDSKLPNVYAPAGRILRPEEIAKAAIYWISEESYPISGQVVELEQYPIIGRNPPKDLSVFQ
jgi:NAD(P)-dependent dehydrogenase (short-subunit alcohol dehydrogenase family)